MKRAIHTVFLSLGSNLGSRLSQLQKATQAIGEIASVEKTSSVYETAPVGPIIQGDYLNMVLEIRTEHTPQDLMLHLLHVEKSLGRQRDVKWGPRSIDIDILFYDQLVLNTAGLTIPHAYYSERRFVVEPLCEIAPEWICPVRGKTMHEICDDLSDHHSVRKTKDTVDMAERKTADELNRSPLDIEG